MAWIPVDQNLARNWKVQNVVADVGIQPLLLSGLLIALWGWAVDNAPDGILRTPFERILEQLGLAKEWTGDVAALRTALLNCGGDKDGLLDVTENGLLKIHGWEEMAGRICQKRLTDRERKRAPAELGDPLDTMAPLAIAFDFMCGEILKLHPRARVPQPQSELWRKWRRAMAQLHSVDHYPISEIAAVIQWLFSGYRPTSSFDWREVTQSAMALRQACRNGRSKFAMIHEQWQKSGGRIRTEEGWTPADDLEFGPQKVHPKTMATIDLGVEYQDREEKMRGNLWDRAMVLLRKEISAEEFNMWLRPTRQEAIEGRTLKIEVPSRHFIERICGQYQAQVDSALKQAMKI